VVLDDDPKPVKAAACEAVDTHHLRLTLTEGKYHQVKRMLAAVGNRVEGLHRSRIGGVGLPGGIKVTLGQGSASAYAATQRAVNAGQVLEGAQGQVTKRQKGGCCRHAKRQQGTGGHAPVPLWRGQNLVLRQWRWVHCR
jgi:hypothetical protein